MRMIGRFITFLAVASGLAACVTGSGEDAGTNDAAFVADHLAFVGFNGHATMLVLERIQSRRGLHYGERYMGAVYQEQTGWERLPVTFNETNPGETIRPAGAGGTASGESTEFAVSGDMASGFNISSKANSLSLSTKPSSHKFSNQIGGSAFTVDAAEATLTYGLLKIEGWAVHEHLLNKPTSRWRQFLTGTPFHQAASVFLRVGHTGLLFLHGEEEEFDGGEAKGASGFTVLKGKFEEIHNVAVNFADTEPGAGFYSWPRAIDLSWQATGGVGKMHTNTVQRLDLANWILGGASLNSLVGELKYSGQTLPVFGLSEAMK